MEISQSFVDQLVSSITSAVREELRRAAGTQGDVSVASFANTLQSALRQATADSDRGAANIAASSSTAASAGAAASANAASSGLSVDENGLSAADRDRLAANAGVIADAGFQAEDLDEWVQNTIAGVRWRASQSGADTAGLDKRQLMALAELETQSDLTANGRNRVLDQALVDRVRSLGNLEGVHVYSALGSLDLEAEVARVRSISSAYAASASSGASAAATSVTSTPVANSASAGTTSSSGISLADLVRNSIESQIARLGT